jgi:hypothetical protein
MDEVKKDVEVKELIPWQKRKELGFLKAFWLTIAQVLSKPGKFFDSLEIKDSYLEPLYFCMINYGLIAVLSTVHTIWLRKGITRIESLALMVLVPLFVFFVFPAIIFAMAAFMHLAVLLLGGKGGFKGTFNVVAYISGTGIIGLIPYVGVLLNWIWNIVIGVIGYKRVHKFNTIRAVIAYCIPLVFFLLLLLASIALPNLLKARVAANEITAKTAVYNIAQGLEVYKAANQGKYPADEYDLNHAIPKYLDRIHNDKVISGYRYSLNLKAGGYEVSASPVACGGTGKKIFTAVTGAAISEKACK